MTCMTQMLLGMGKKVGKKPITVRLNEGLLARLDEHRRRGPYEIDRTKIIEVGVEYVLQVNDQRDGALELLEDILAFQQTDRPEWYEPTLRQALNSVVKDFVRHFGIDETRKAVEETIGAETRK